MNEERTGLWWCKHWRDVKWWQYLTWHIDTPSIYDFWLPLFFQFFSYNPLDQLKANVTLLVINILYEFCFIQKFNTTARPIMISDQLKFQKLFSETTCVLESLYGGKWPSMILSKLITWLHVNTTTVFFSQEFVHIYNTKGNINSNKVWVRNICFIQLSVGGVDRMDYMASCKYNHNTVYGLRIKGYGV
jgi:hypothetical protein